MNSAFKIGDTVKLKSGGPMMTISRIDHEGTVWCVWFTKKETADTTARDGFHPNMLMSVT